MADNKFKFNILTDKYKAAFVIDQYTDNGNTAVSIMVWDEEGQYWDNGARLSINTDVVLPEGQFVAKTYSENEGIVEQLESQGLIEPCGQSVNCGHAGPQPVYKLTDKGKAAIMSQDDPPEQDRDMIDNIADAFNEKHNNNLAAVVWENDAYLVIDKAGRKWTALELDGWVFTMIGE